AILENASITITFSTAMNPATLVAKTTLDNGPCIGSIMLSTDDFSTCVPFASAAPVMSAGDTVAILQPAPGLSFGSNYKIRVTTAAEAAGGAALGAPYTQPTGFTTRVAPAN